MKGCGVMARVCVCEIESLGHTLDRILSSTVRTCRLSSYEVDSSKNQCWIDQQDKQTENTVHHRACLIWN